MVRSLSPEELAERLSRDASELLLLDVRERYERDVAAIEPSLHIPMDEVPAYSHTLPMDRDIVVYCHHGTRSYLVASYLMAGGFRRVLNLDGGIDAWSRRVDPSIPRYG